MLLQQDSSSLALAEGRQAFSAQVGVFPPPTQGSAPMWSSCPCVMTTASILSRHCDRKLVSGRIFCMPRSVKLQGREGQL